MEANYNYKEWFTWDENESTKQMQIEGQQIEQKHCDTTTATQNELMPNQCKDTTKTKDRKEYYKQYYIKNKEHKQQYDKRYGKQYRINNKEHISQYRKQYRIKNKDILRQKRKHYNKQYRIKNKELIARYNKQYRIQYPIRRLYQYIKNRRNTDIQFRLATNLRARLCSAIRQRQKVGSAVRDLGCSIEEFKSYIESKFQSGMSWDNWGRDGWHIDHIKPLSSFDLTDRQQFVEACHYTNLQPLWAEDNFAKSNRVVTLTE
jgi:hypothetical protein